MVTVFYRIGLYVSSFFPLYILLILDNIKYLLDYDTIKKIVTFQDLLPSLFFSSLSLLSLISILSVIVLKRISHNERYAFNEIKRTQDNLLSYVVTYLVPILSIKIDDLSSLLVNLGLFSLLGFIYVKNSLVYLNPLFLFFKYNIFISGEDKIIISNYNINELKILENEKLNVRKLNYNIFLIRRNENGEI